MRTWKKWSANYIIAMLVHAVQENWLEKKLAVTLFIDVKQAFDHISKSQLLECMIDFGIDENLVVWMKFFLSHRNIQSVINEYDNKKEEIVIIILWKSLESLILLLIYIGGVFDIVAENNLTITFLSFVNNIRFIDFYVLVKKISQTLV